MRESTFSSIRFVLTSPSVGAGAQHAQWMEQRKAQGWTYGDVRDDTLKHHPMLVLFDQLSEAEQKKGHLVGALVAALTRAETTSSGHNPKHSIRLRYMSVLASTAIKDISFSLERA